MADEAATPEDDDDVRRGPGLPIIGIGASAGGVKTLQALFDALPTEIGAAFVVIVHLDPDSRSELASILSAHSTFQVEQVTATESLKPRHVYVIPPDRQLRITDHEISAVPFTEPRGQRAPIDLFFRSLAEQKGDGCAVILTGAGSDGAVGVKAIKEAGGIVLVQDPKEAEYSSMPRSAIATGVADFVLPTKELAQRLVELVRAKKETQLAPENEDNESLLRRILAHLRARTGHDFSHYKQTTVYRRVLRRMQVSRTNTLKHYFKYLRETHEESQALLADLLISVTTFFRDAGCFDVLAKQVVPRFFEGPEPEAVRVWIPGCATGEEAYSIAILLLEEAARHDLRPDLQVFASDLDSAALKIARDGRYPCAIAADVSEERLGRFFTADGEFYRVKHELRDIVVFANHSLLKDPPFSRLDLISCRNLLIYLDREMQQQVLTTLHYGLNANGYLFLGNSENAEHPAGLFRAVDREAKIFQSTGRRRDLLPALPARLLPRGAGAATVAPGATDARSRARGSQQLHQEALETVAPPSILVDDTWRVLHLSETAGRFLQPSAGPLSTDVVDLVRQELRPELRSALNRAFERGETTLSPTLFVQFNGAAHRMYVQVKPVTLGERRGARALILFIESGSAEHPPSATAGEEPSGGDAERRLQHELELMQIRLRAAREESESATEELRATNEELQSINEEYRSTAEELETSREELQSINEELQTVNSELKLKLDAVSRANSDLQNLMAAADFGTLFLDPDQKIKLFTPRIADLFNITPGDIGRPITDLTNRLDYEFLSDDAAQVVKEIAPLEREVRSRDGGWYIARLRPYRTTEDRIDGLVMTFVDITRWRRTEDALRASEANLKREMRLVERSVSPIFVWDFDDGILKWNRGSEALYGYTGEEALGKSLSDLLRTAVPGSSVDRLRRELLEKGVWQGELRQFAKDGRPLAVESSIELVPVDGRRYVLESVRDVTERKAMERRQELLVLELTHRVKNLLTVVQGMVHQSGKGTSSVPEFIRKLDGRLTALADSQRLLIDSVWEGADLRGLIERQLRPYAGDDFSRVKLAGEPVVLPGDIATPFALVLHELATNAAKYGALSEEKGWVDVSWSLADGNNGRLLKVLWKEMDGPHVHPPSATGFGSQLIRQGLATAKVRYEFLSHGIECTLELPLPSQSWGK